MRSAPAPSAPASIFSSWRRRTGWPSAVPGGRSCTGSPSVTRWWPTASASPSAIANLNRTLLGQIRTFLDEFGIEIYSEHLSFSRDQQGYLYELLPVPRQWENIPYLAERIAQVQEALARPLVLENISYYHGYDHEMPEEDFLAELVARSGCELLLDINNVFVNSRNHGYCPKRMIAGLPGSAIRYFHIAGHLEEADGTLLDTHGKPVCEEVVALARYTVQTHGLRPLLLGRITICHRWQSWRPSWHGCTAPVARRSTVRCGRCVMGRRLSLITAPKTAPQRMQQQTAWLASRVRLPEDGIASHYARSVRANVESVLESAFPLTHAHWAPVDRWQLVEGFVIAHGAEAPEFHHIATEFVRYVQHRHGEGSLNWPRQRLALLEYEWACLCVEIDQG